MSDVNKNNWKGKSAVVTDENGVEHKFGSQSQAARHTGVNQGSISAMCRGKMKLPVKGWTARFDTGFEQEKPSDSAPGL